MLASNGTSSLIVQTRDVHRNCRTVSPEYPLQLQLVGPVTITAKLTDRSDGTLLATFQVAASALYWPRAGSKAL